VNFRISRQGLRHDGSRKGCLLLSEGVTASFHSTGWLWSRRPILFVVFVVHRCVWTWPIWFVMVRCVELTFFSLLTGIHEFIYNLFSFFFHMLLSLYFNSSITACDPVVPFVYIRSAAGPIIMVSHAYLVYSYW